MPAIRRYSNRRRAKVAQRALAQLGYALKTQMVVMRDGTVYVSCDTKDAPALALLFEGEIVGELPASVGAALGLDRRVVEVYRDEAALRFQSGSGGGMVPADPGRSNGPRANSRPRAGARR